MAMLVGGGGGGGGGGAGGSFQKPMRVRKSRSKIFTYQ